LGPDQQDRGKRWPCFPEAQGELRVEDQAEKKRAKGKNGLITGKAGNDQDVKRNHASPGKGRREALNRTESGGNENHEKGMPL